MRPIVIGLIAACVAAIILPTAALAATASAATKPVDPAAIKAGVAAAPSVIKATGVDCDPANARLIGKSTDPKTKASSTYYELACKGAEGFIVSVPDKEGASQIYTCLEVAASPNAGVACVLPENADPKQGLAPLVAKYKPSCVMTAARAIGQTSDHTATVFEVACQGGPGYNIQASFPETAAKPAQFAPCYALVNTAMKCTLTDDATSNAYITGLAAKMGKPCQVKDQKYVGATADGSVFIEVACQDGKGYMIEQTANGEVKPGIECAAADNIGGGCTLTNARQAETEQAGLYSRLAHNAGFACDVSRYAPFQVDVPQHEVVELACSNRPDGAIGIFGATAADGSQVIDCAHSELRGYRCSFTKPDAALPSLTADLNKLGKTSCVVSGERIAGVSTETKEGYIEVTCADGNAGYLIAYTLPAVTPKEATVCTLARNLVGGCTLPGNAPKHG
ncbi:MAG TPA: hypothetical protein VMT68_20675 [Caulobacteraceae bacterium]|nr:hypothetical protein [Caulobacteraceae bacterium]